MSENYDSALTYTSYLAVDDLLKLQKPLSEGPEHDELLFIIIHQTYELWFKQLIHEFAEAQRALEANETHRALGVLGRIRTIMKTCVSQVDILETMTPLQFLSFRNYLAASSGFQSAQFRKVEAILGRRDEKFANHLPPEMRDEIIQLLGQRSLWDSVMIYLSKRGAAIPESVLNRNLRDHYQPNEQVQAALVKVLTEAGYAPGELEVVEPQGYGRYDPTWETNGVRVTVTNQVDLQLSGEFRKY